MVMPKELYPYCRSVDPDPNGSAFILSPGSAFNMRNRNQEGKIFK